MEVESKRLLINAYQYEDILIYKNLNIEWNPIT